MSGAALEIKEPAEAVEFLEFLIREKKGDTSPHVKALVAVAKKMIKAWKDSRKSQNWSHPRNQGEEIGGRSAMNWVVLVLAHTYADELGDTQ